MALQVADNSTIAANLSSLNDRVNAQVALEAVDNSTQAANLSDLHALVYAKPSAGDGGGNATASGVASYIPAFLNTTHIVPSPISANGSSMVVASHGFNVTVANITIDENYTLCLNRECSRYIRANSTGVLIQG